MTHSPTNDDRRIYLKLLHSGLYKAYQDAFVSATGLPLVLRFPGASNEKIPLVSEHQSPFCALLHKQCPSCEECHKLRCQLTDKACEKPQTMACFAGMRETAIPVRLGKHTVALLETGQVFFKKPTKKEFAKVAKVLLDEGRCAKEVEQLRDAFMETNVIEKDRYRSMLILLNAFALQLGDLANRIVLEHKAAEPAVVRRAKEYIMENLERPLRLDDVATHANVSSYYFCKIFKQATGITFTEFVNRQRVESAKRLLINPESRVTEIAYDVGFQSLSQFNRSFLKIVGDSPTQYRRRMKGNKKQLANA